MIMQYGTLCKNRYYYLINLPVQYSVYTFHHKEKLHPFQLLDLVLLYCIL